MGYLTVEGAVKRYGPVTALDGVSLGVEPGEFFTLLGPSGCGKTTILRSIAGFSDLTAGEIRIAGESLIGVPPHRRDIGMVFQDYAVFPHLTVAENVAFGLKARKVPAAEIRSRVGEILDMVRLGAMADRLPAAMSGGQQQRIGIARAMVIRPRLLLMDEPLSNLDAKLRIELRAEIRAIQKAVGIAAIYVTHDQEEALAISDRICVMNQGRVEQIGTPQEIYGRPATRFVAGFVGTMNFLAPGVGGIPPAPGAATRAVRPEHVRLADGDGEAAGSVQVEGTVSHYTYLGREAHITVASPAGPIVAQIAAPSPDLSVETGRTVRLAFDAGQMHGFDAEGLRIDGAVRP
ncbi:ABC transporter ATP-binding protein [Prosthecomicrobium sp. N25]|uniref:ABC transporter ATP-binding protein n=1 Tax=Prosthecomicrobium sp. N25 TaxID=3129254 RepID=UPI00307753F2